MLCTPQWLQPPSVHTQRPLLRGTPGPSRLGFAGPATAMDFDAVDGDDVVGAVGDAGAKAHHDACIALMWDPEPAVQTECTVHDRPSPSSRYLRHLKVGSGQLGADSVPLD